MREILFRGKRVDNGEWVYGSFIPDLCELLYGDKLDGFIKPFGKIRKERLMVEVDRKTVGQYTGLTDKNGKQIFEGDILGAKHPKQMKAVPCLVKYGEYKDEDGLSDCRYLGFCLQALGKCCSILTPLSDGIEYEVIGNIHDNPELLERGAKNE